MKCMSLQFLQVGPVRGCERFTFRQVHLSMKNIESFDAEFGCFVDDGFNGHFWGSEMPIGISRDAQFDALFAR